LRKEIDYEFPPNQSMPAGGFLILVSFDPGADPAGTAAFRARNFVPDNVPLYGPWRSSLDNGGAAIELSRPDVPVVATNAAGIITNVTVPYILVERVQYSDVAPWASGADGFGLTLQRVVPSSYGDDPTNWVAVAPSPGANFISGATSPTITSQPGSRVIATGTDTVLAVGANGTLPLRYQWRYNGANIYGATSATLTLANFQFSQAGTYSVLVFTGSIAREPTKSEVSPAGRSFA
jgi:hypothetical protein